MNRPAAESHHNPYRGVVILLFAAALAGTTGAFYAGPMLGNPVIYAAAITLGLATGVLAGVVAALTVRTRLALIDAGKASTAPAADTAVSESDVAAPEIAAVAVESAPTPPDSAAVALESTLATPESAPLTPEGRVAPPESASALPEGTSAPPDKRPRWAEILGDLPIKPAIQRVVARTKQWLADLGPIGIVRVATGVWGVLAILRLLWRGVSMDQPTGMVAGIEAGTALVAAGLVAVASRYLSGIDAEQLPESPGLLRGARIAAWVLVLAAASAGLSWLTQRTILQVLYYAILAINLAICVGLFTARVPAGEEREIFPLDIAVLSVLGSRTNILASIQDAAEAQFGIDLRSTWALTVVRRGLEPLVIGLCLVGWLSTSLTVVGPSEQGLIERSGVPVSGPPLEPGLHVHWPWPVDRVFRIPVKLVQALNIGHEGEEEGGPENVLWAYKHAENEYTLLLGNGRDLLTIDAGVQFRIADARAWRYHSQNPADALKALSYRAVTRSIVGRTLQDALSENVARWAGEMKAEIQKEANELGLGVEVLSFTVGGMHPPVPVAIDYQAVVSAELRKVTAVVNAQAFRNQTLPDAEATVLMGDSAARSEAANALAQAAGEAWSFRALESEFHAAPEEYYFRRRLETLEKSLAGSAFTVVDTRFQRDGGELWVTP